MRVALGGEEANMILLTGPNMGGKSTLLRQVRRYQTILVDIIGLYCNYNGTTWLLRPCFLMHDDSCRSHLHANR
jgi:hypothetical protein